MLLVDDDVVYRMLSEKLLQVFGCMIDIAVDGAAAVTKMNLEKYDLVFMVCSLPLHVCLPFSARNLSLSVNPITSFRFHVSLCDFISPYCVPMRSN